MKSTIHIFLFLLFVALTACNSQTTPTEGIETIKFTFSGENPKYEDVFKKTTIIPLETNENCLIQTISQMEVWNDKMFILDWKSNLLFVFNSDGKFINKIGRIGRGPGEYIRPRYFFINKDEKQVKVFDAPTKKLMCFSLDGKLIKEIRLDNYLRAVGETETGYWGFCVNKANTNVDEEQKKIVKFITFDKNGEEENYIKGEKTIDNLNFSQTYIAQAVDGGVSFVEPYRPNICCVKNGQITTKYKIDYSGHFPSGGVLNKIENLKHPMSGGDKDFSRKLSTDYASRFMQFLENENWLLLFTGYEITTLIYNKKTRQTHEFSKRIFSENGWETYNPMCCCLSESAVYSELNYPMAKWLTEDKDNFSERRKDALNELYGNMNMDDNPFIVKYEIRE